MHCNNRIEIGKYKIMYCILEPGHNGKCTPYLADKMERDFDAIAKEQDQTTYICNICKPSRVVPTKYKIRHEITCHGRRWSQ
jgi:hypothetical protein